MADRFLTPSLRSVAARRLLRNHRLNFLSGWVFRGVGDRWALREPDLPYNQGCCLGFVGVFTGLSAIVTLCSTKVLSRV